MHTVHAHHLAHIPCTAGAANMSFLQYVTTRDGGYVLASAQPQPQTQAVQAQPSRPTSHAWTVGEKPKPGGLGSDLGKLLASGEWADVCLVAAGGKRLMAHSLVLRSRSRWFELRLVSMAPAAEGPVEVDLQEHSVDTLRALLSFLYTGYAEVDAGDEGDGAQEPGVKRMKTSGRSDRHTMGLVRLLHAATLFDVSSLHDACAVVATVNIGTDCALQWLVFASEHKETTLKAIAMAFAVNHYHSIGKDAFADIGPDLVLEVLDTMARDFMAARIASTARWQAP